MHIIFLSRLFHPHIGGVEKHVFNLSQTLIKNGHTVEVITEKFSDDIPNKEIYKKILIRRIPVSNDEKNKKYEIWKWMIKNRKLFQNTDIIHCHDVFFWYLPLRLLMTDKKIYTTFHGYEGNKKPNIKSRLMHKLAEELSEGNITVGSFYQKWYKTKSTIISFGATDKNKYINRSGKKYDALYVGRLESEVGILEYLNALIILKDKKDISLLVIGDGSQRKKAEKIAKKNKLNVVFKGFVKNPEEYIVKSDIVFTSRYLAILEALIYRKHVFSLYNNEIKNDYLKMTPFSKWISISGNSNDLAKQLLNFFDNKNKLSNKISKGSDWAEKQTWDKMAAKYISLWKKV